MTAKKISVPPKKEAREEPLALRITPSLKRALEAAAQADERSVSQIVIRALEKAMREQGFLK